MCIDNLTLVGTYMDLHLPHVHLCIQGTFYLQQLSGNGFRIHNISKAKVCFKRALKV